MLRSLIVPALVVIVLVAAGEGFRRAATIEEQLGAAETQLLTSGAASRSADEAVDGALAPAVRIPVLGPRLAQQVRRSRATQAYWQRDYDLLTNGALAPAETETDGALLLLSANAGYRSTVGRKLRPADMAKALDDSLKAYARVLDQDPSAADAAYNYEFVSRLRSALAGGRTSGAPTGNPRDMQGETGEPPKGAQKSDFKVIVPMRPEERQEQMDPGTGGAFQRKG